MANHFRMSGLNVRPRGFNDYRHLGAGKIHCSNRSTSTNAHFDMGGWTRSINQSMAMFLKKPTYLSSKWMFILAAHSSISRRFLFKKKNQVFADQAISVKNAMNCQSSLLGLSTYLVPPGALS